MVKRGLALFMAVTLSAASLCACGGREQPGDNGIVQEDETSGNDGTGEASAAPEENAAPELSDAPEQVESDNEQPDDAEDALLYTGEVEIKVRDANVTPSVAPYTVEADLSNIDNLWQFYLQDEVQEKLVQNDLSCAVMRAVSFSRFMSITDMTRLRVL